MKCGLQCLSAFVFIGVASAASFSFTNINIPGGGNASAINDVGQIVGNQEVGGSSQGFLDSGGSFSSVICSGSKYTSPAGINNSGQIVGYYQTSTFTFHGFLKTKETCVTLDYPGASQTLAQGVNNLGRVVGYYDNQSAGFLYSNGSFSGITIPGAKNTSAIGINDSGQIVGYYVDSQGVSHGFLDNNGAFTTIDIPGADGTIVTGINNQGQMVGWYSTQSGEHSFIYTLGTFIIGIDYPGLAGYPGVPPETFFNGINNSGQIIGFTSSAAGEFGFVATLVTVTQTVTTTSLTSSVNPVKLGQSVTLTATVTPSTATGTVTFLDGTTKLGNGTLSNGTAAFAISSLPGGAHSLTAVYGGDTNDAGSTSSVLTETVNQPTQTVTTTSLTSSANPSIFGQSITLTAKVSPSTATGTVAFRDGSTTLGTANLSAGTAIFNTTGLSQGTHSLTAVYSGNTNDAGSTSAVLTQTVNQVVTVQPRVGGSLTCTLPTISGPYGYAISGLLSASGKLTPFADYGSFVANGSGTFVGVSTESTGGAIASRTLSGSYSINGNCTGTATFTDSLGNALHVSFTVVGNGGKIQFIQTDGGTVVSGTAQRAPTGCDASAVSGPYTYAISGWIAVTGGFEPFADAGRIVSDGKGNLTGKSTYSASGTIGRRTFTGSYAINSNCTGTATLKDSLGNADTLAITIVNNGQQVLFIETDSGTVVSGGSQGGQYTCSAGVLIGPYSYALEGYSITSSGGIIPGADSGLLTSDGSGRFTGADSVSAGGTIASRTVSGSYTVSTDCTGSVVFADNFGNIVNLDVFVANGGLQVQFIQTDSGTVTSGSAQHAPGGTCTNATLNGAYGYAIEGWTVSSSIAPFADSGQVTADGAGHLSGADTASAGGTIINRVSTGSYQINSDCSGSVSLVGSTGPANLHINASSDGRQIAFIETDAGTIISGGAQRQLAFPADGIVSAASYALGAVVPGSLFTIFGDGLSPGSATAGPLPWPTQLGGTSVSVNGTAVPLYYVSSTQIDGQLPLEIQPGPAQLVISDGLTSAPVGFTVAATWPGIFTYGLSRAVAVNPDGGLNGPAALAHSGDVLVVYLTGGGPVSPSTGWMTGMAAPLGLSRVTLPFTATIGGLPALVDYLGLTPTYVGLYQLNVHVPALPAGDQTLAVTIDGHVSNSALISVAP